MSNPPSGSASHRRSRVAGWRNGRAVQAENEARHNPAHRSPAGDLPGTSPGRDGDGSALTTPGDPPPVQPLTTTQPSVAAPVHTEGPFRVLFVCTANQCRSPLAEHLLRQAVERRGLDWTISSAGTQAIDGQPMDTHAEAVLLERMAPPSNWSSQRLSVNLITEADLILTAHVEHRQIVLMTVPSASRRTFTLLQFARFTRQFPATFGPVESGAQLLERAANMRVLLQPPAVGEDDLDDPIGRSIRAFRACADTITTANGRILAPLGAETKPIAQ